MKNKNKEALHKFSEVEFEVFARDCSERAPCDDMACADPFHCDHEDSEFRDCRKDKCPRLRWLEK